jgi:hypothetical protein
MSGRLPRSGPGCAKRLGAGPNPNSTILLGPRVVYGHDAGDCRDYVSYSMGICSWVGTSLCVIAPPLRAGLRAILGSAARGNGRIGLSLLIRGAFRFLCRLSAIRREPTHRAGCKPAECDKSRTYRHVGLLEDFLPQLHRGDTRHACYQAQEDRARAQRSDGRVLLPDLQAMALDVEVANAAAALGKGPKRASLPKIWSVIAATDD